MLPASPDFKRPKGANLPLSVDRRSKAVDCRVLRRRTLFTQKSLTGGCAFSLRLCFVETLSAARDNSPKSLPTTTIPTGVVQNVRVTNVRILFQHEGLVSMAADMLK